MPRIAHVPAALLVIAVLALPGCSATGPAPAPSTCTDPASTGHIVVGYKTDRPGLTQQDGDTFIGFEPALVGVLAGDMQLAVTSEPISTGSWGLELDECTISIAVASISWTGPRAADFYLTSAYLQTQLGVLAAVGQTLSPDVTGFTGQKVCYVVSSDTDEPTTAQSDFAKQQYSGMAGDPESSSDQCLTNLLNGRDEFFVSDAAILRGIFLDDYSPTGGTASWSFSENNDFGTTYDYVVALKRDPQHLALCLKISSLISQYTASVSDDDTWWQNFSDELGGPTGDSQKAALQNSYFPSTKPPSPSCT